MLICCVGVVFKLVILLWSTNCVVVFLLLIRVSAIGIKLDLNAYVFIDHSRSLAGEYSDSVKTVGDSLI